VDGKTGVLTVSQSSAARHQLDVLVSPALVPALMPLLARLRSLFDLDAEPTVVDAQLARVGLRRWVARRPGLRIPGAFDGIEAVLRALLGGRAGLATSEPAKRLVEMLGERVECEIPGLGGLAPDPARVAEAGVAALVEAGLAQRPAETLARIARALAERRLWLEPGSDVAAAHRALVAIDGVGERLATRIVAHALHWPDAFDATDRRLQLAAGAADADEFRLRAERWRPWRGYAALHLLLGGRT
jgi:AraC family transcriptional regulator of adaptative response / DNA-3-methyladenine glycosylase II